MSENRAIEILRADVEFSRYRMDVLRRADESMALISALGERIDRDMALIGYMERAQVRAEGHMKVM